MRVLVDRVSKVYRDRSGTELAALDAIDLAVESEEFVALVGPSGCGKSTLLGIIAGLLPATSGRVVFEGERRTGTPLAATVFQEFALFPWRTVRANVELGLEELGVSRDERARRARRVLDVTGLAGFEARYPHQLSGGMRQRVGIARALAIEPSVLLMDEPFGALDAQTRESMQKALVDIWHAAKKTVLFITHDIREATYLSDRVLVMTGRPATISLELKVDLPRPRNRHDAKFQDCERRLEQAIGTTAA